MIAFVGGELQIPWGTIATVVTTIGGYLLAFAVIVRVLLQQREASATLAWILIIVFLPFLGVALFFLVGRPRVRRRARKRLRARSALERGTSRLPYREGGCDLVVPELDMPELPRMISRVATCVNGTPPLQGNRTEVFIDADAAYDRMEAAIRSARRHVHMMSYIYRDDLAGGRFRDLLTEKATEGVEVRLLVDAVGSHEMGAGFFLPLQHAGGKYAQFMPVLPLRPHWRPNLRNHRKILVVDGRVGFAGGLNIGDEYQGRKKKYAPWRDTHMRAEGPAAWRLQEIFAEDWFFATDEDLIEPRYFPRLQPSGEDLIQVVESGPDQPHETIHTVFFTAITGAQQSIYITTPYFVPDAAVLLALKAASWRGVDVRVLIPGKSDLKLIQMAGRSYHRELLEAGVRLYEHRPGMLHAKTMVVDGIWATVGSANMDVRSFRLNFEVNLLVSGSSFASRMEAIFKNDIAGAHELTLEGMTNKSRATRFAESICRMLSPVL
jgi:cardiolipin synthase